MFLCGLTMGCVLRNEANIRGTMTGMVKGGKGARWCLHKRPLNLSSAQEPN